MSCRSARSFHRWKLTAIMTALLLSAAAQQDEGPILKPKKRPAKPASSTLLVFCDLACDWNLDGVAKGRIEAGASAREKVDPGQHLVVAATEDGVDQFKQVSELKPAEQTVLSISLKPLRDARLKSEQEAQAKAALTQQQKEEAARVEQAREREEHDKATKEQVIHGAAVASTLPTTPSKTVRKSTVYVLRPSNAAIFSAATIASDGRTLGKLGHHEYLDFPMQPGSHNLTVQKRVSTPELSWPFTVTEGQDLFIVLDWEPTGAYSATWTVHSTEMQTGRALIKNLKPVKMSDRAPQLAQGIDQPENRALGKSAEPAISTVPATDSLETNKPNQSNQQDLELGAQVYKSKCKMCHGATGKGETGAGRALKVKSIIDVSVYALTENQMCDVVKNGAGKMPGFRSKLTDVEVTDVVSYFRNLGK
jgi:cytochrome c6